MINNKPPRIGCMATSATPETALLSSPYILGNSPWPQLSPPHPVDTLGDDDLSSPSGSGDRRQYGPANAPGRPGFQGTSISTGASGADGRERFCDARRGAPLGGRILRLMLAVARCYR